MADVSPGATPDRGAPPPSSEAPAPVFPASATPGAPPSTPGGFNPAARFLADEATRQSPAAPAPALGPAATAVFGTEPIVAPTGTLPQLSEAAPRSLEETIGRRRTGWRRWAPMFLVIFFLLAGAIGMLIFLGHDMGPAALAVGLTAAIVPVPLLVASFLWLDRYEPEPVRYLAFAFAWGAAIATSVALLVNTGTAWLFDKIGLPDALVAVLVAPFIEESMKALGPILLFVRRRHEWSGITDGIVYCGLSALGFAMVENVLYLGKLGYASGVEQYGPATGLQNVFAIFIVRILFTGFAHPLFTSMTGIGLGIASRARDRWVRWLAPVAGLLLAMMLHGTFNLLPTLSVNLNQPLIMLYGYLGFMVPLFFAVVGFAIALRSWEGRLTERILPYYVRTGWFSPPEVAALGSLGRRHSARQWAKRVAGAGGQRAMKSFQFAATQLALLRDGLQRGLEHRPEALHQAEAEERRLLNAIVEYRDAFAGRDPQTPQAFWDGRNYRIAFPDGVTRTVPPPVEPVVPVPVRYQLPAYPSPYGAPAYGAQPGYPLRPGYPGTGVQPGRPAAPSYPAASGYPAAPSYPPPPSYPAPPSYPVAPSYPAPTGYGSDLGRQPPGYSTPVYQPPARPYGYVDPAAPAPPPDDPTSTVEPPTRPGG